MSVGQEKTVIFFKNFKIQCHQNFHRRKRSPGMTGTGLVNHLNDVSSYLKSGLLQFFCCFVHTSFQWQAANAWLLYFKSPVNGTIAIFRVVSFGNPFFKSFNCIANFLTASTYLKDTHFGAINIHIFSKSI
ncbi:MAG: hypothetical protein ACD_13C00228G0015 [uncultured bacterium]|nr:MAG: hypothetical protein ACD_13C00228G0015 [uncultured bacterium]